MYDEEVLKHNVKYYCYDCCKDAIVKESRYGRKNITEYGRILWFRKHGRVTFAELDEYQINYADWEPKVSFWPSAQYRFTKESQEYYKHTPEGYWTPDRWERRKDVKLPYATGGMWNYYCVPRYQKTVTHPSFLRERGSDLKYANLDMLRLGFNAPDNPYALIGYIYNFLKYPSIEILEKAGFEYIAGQRANEREKPRRQLACKGSPKDSRFEAKGNQRVSGARKICETIRARKIQRHKKDGLQGFVQSNRHAVRLQSE